MADQDRDRYALTDEEIQQVEDRTVKTLPAGLTDDEVNARVFAALENDHNAKRASMQRPLQDTTRWLARGVLNTLPAVGAMVGGALSTPETFGAGTVPGIALGAGAGRGLRDLVGHYTGLDEPTTPVQKLEHIGGETAVTGATAVLLPGLVQAAKAPLRTLGEASEQFGSAMPPTIRRLSRLFPPIPKGAPGPNYTRPYTPEWPPFEPEPSGAPPPGWSTPPPGGTGATAGVPPVGNFSMPRSTVAPPSGASADTTAAAGDDVAAAVRARGLDPSKIVSVGPRADAAAVAKQPIAPMAAHTPPASPLQQPRVDVGAEDVGRGLGKTKEQVRGMTDPLFGENKGEASPILPQETFDRVFAKLKDLPKGSPERDAYVAAARDPKTRGQLENMLRALKHLGMGLSGASVTRSAMQDELEKMMRQRGDQSR